MRRRSPRSSSTPCGLGLDPGAADVLDQYERARRADITAMGLMTDGLNRLFSNDVLPVRLIRDLGLGLVDRMPGLKRFFIREAARPDQARGAAVVEGRGAVELQLHFPSAKRWPQGVALFHLSSREEVARREGAVRECRIWPDAALTPSPSLRSTSPHRGEVGGCIRVVLSG